jgi:hypothetical protein
MGILLLIALILVILAVVGGIAFSPLLWLILIAAAIVALIGFTTGRT